MRTYQAIGTAVYYIDSGEPHKEPRKATEMVDGDARVSRLQLCYCRDGCGKYFTAMFPATLCAACEDAMRDRNETCKGCGDHTTCLQGLCQHCTFDAEMEEAAGRRGEDW